MEWSEFVKVYGPLGLGWVGFGYLGWWLLQRLDRFLEAQVKLALTLDGLTKAIEELRREDR